MLRINVSTASAEIAETELITAGRVGLRCGFAFDSVWDGLAKTVVVSGAVKRDVVLVGNEIEVPGECLDRENVTLKIGVYGKNGEGTVVIPTVWVSFGKVLSSAKSSGEEAAEPTPDVVAQIQQNSANALLLAQRVMQMAESGEFDGANGAPGAPGTNGAPGASAYQIAVAHGYEGTEAEWLESLHGQDATVDATLTNPGEAADAAAAGAGIRAAQHSADYAKIYAETLNSGDGIPLDTEWALYGISDSRAYRIHSVDRITAIAQTVLQISAGYRFYLRIYSAGGYTDTSWYGPAYLSRQTYTVPAGTDYRVVIGAYPEDSSVVLTDEDVGTYAAQLSIVNNIGSGSGSGGVTVDDALSGSSANPVQNKVIKAALDGKGTYSKPSGGIPKTDMAEDVQTSLGKANTALQQHQSLAGYATERWVSQQGYLTQHQSLTAYRTAAAQDVIDAGKADKVQEVTVATDGAVSQTVEPGKAYHFTGELTALTITAATPGEGHYHLDFVSGATAPTVTMPGAWIMPDGWTVEANTRYEIDVLDGYAVAQGWGVST